MLINVNVKPHTGAEMLRNAEIKPHIGAGQNATNCYYKTPIRD